jgi:hypothetical protein
MQNFGWSSPLPEAGAGVRDCFAVGFGLKLPSERLSIPYCMQYHVLCGS